MENNNELMHYGILGMKWGVRRTEAQLAKAQGRVDKLKAKKQAADRLARAQNKLGKAKAEEEQLKKYLKKGKSTEPSENAPKKRSVKEMSDEELRAKINRINLEKQYKDLTTPKEQSKSSAGKAFVSDVLKNSGKNIATQFATYALGTATNKIFAESFGEKQIVNPKKGQKDK